MNAKVERRFKEGYDWKIVETTLTQNSFGTKITIPLM